MKQIIALRATSRSKFGAVVDYGTCQEIGPVETDEMDGTKIGEIWNDTACLINAAIEKVTAV